MIKVGMREKNRYEQMLSEYLSRRSGLKLKTKVYTEDRYKQILKRLNRRIQHCKKQIKAYNKKIEFLKNLYRYTIAYFKDDPKNNGKLTNKPQLARDMFFRYGLENGAAGCVLSDFLGFYRGSNYSIKARTRVMKTQDKKDVYKSFCKFIFEENGSQKLEIKKRVYKMTEQQWQEKLEDLRLGVKKVQKPELATQS